MADSGALFDYFLQITPEAEKVFDTRYNWTTTFSCTCMRFRTRETRVCERGISISLHNDQPLIHHILREFQPENVNGYKCEESLPKSDDGNPATRHRNFLSLPRLLKITIAGPQTSTGLPPDYHPYDARLILHSPGIPTEIDPVQFVLSNNVLQPPSLELPAHSPTPIIIDDKISRIATSADMEQVAMCARVLLYEQVSPQQCSSVPATCVPANGPDAIVLTLPTPSNPFSCTTRSIAATKPISARVHPPARKITTPKKSPAPRRQCPQQRILSDFLAPGHNLWPLLSPNLTCQLALDH